MMILDSLTTVLYTSIFLVPGFIIKSILETVIPSRKIIDMSYFLMCLLYSLINFLVIGWLYPIIIDSFSSNTSLLWLLLVIANLLSSIIISIVFCIIEHNKIIQNLYRKILKIDYVNEYGSA